MSFKETHEKVRKEIEEGKKSGDLPKGYRLGVYIGKLLQIIIVVVAMVLWGLK